MAANSSQDAKQASKNGMPLSNKGNKGKQHPKSYSKGSRKSSRKS